MILPYMPIVSLLARAGGARFSTSTLKEAGPPAVAYPYLPQFKSKVNTVNNCLQPRAFVHCRRSALLNKSLDLPFRPGLVRRGQAAVRQKLQSNVL